jgi:hypothetical protein
MALTEIRTACASTIITKLAYHWFHLAFKAYRSQRRIPGKRRSRSGRSIVSAIAARTQRATVLMLFQLNAGKTSFDSRRFMGLTAFQYSSVIGVSNSPCNLIDTSANVVAVSAQCRSNRSRSGQLTNRGYSAIWSGRNGKSTGTRQGYVPLRPRWWPKGRFHSPRTTRFNAGWRAGITSLAGTRTISRNSEMAECNLEIDLSRISRWDCMRQLSSRRCRRAASQAVSESSRLRRKRSCPPVRAQRRRGRVTRSPD